MADEDILAQAATATGQMVPRQNLPLTGFAPSPMTMPTMPPRFQPPAPTHPQAGNSFGTVGEHQRANKQALFSSVANMIKAGGDYVQAKKQRMLTMDIQRLMESQQGMQEAQQALQQDPNNQAAKEALQRNTAIINDITSDPKKVKLLQKAFDIDLFGTKGGKNQNEQKALQEAWKQYNTKKQTDPNALNPNAQKLMQMQPQRMQVNPQLQLQAELIKSGILPKADSLVKAMQENYKTLMTASSAQARTAAISEHNKIIEENAKLIAGVQDRRTAAQLEAAMMRRLSERDRFSTQLKISQMRSSDTDRRIQAAEDIAGGKNDVMLAKIKSAEKIAADKNSTMKERADAQMIIARSTALKNSYGNLNNQLKMAQDYRKKLVESNNNLQKELDKKPSSILGFHYGGMSSNDANAARTQILTNTKLMHDADTNIGILQQQMQTLGETSKDLLGQDSGINPGSLNNPIEFTPPTESNEDQGPEE